MRFMPVKNGPRWRGSRAMFYTYVLKGVVPYTLQLTLTLMLAPAEHLIIQIIITLIIVRRLFVSAVTFQHLEGIRNVNLLSAYTVNLHVSLLGTYTASFILTY